MAKTTDEVEAGVIETDKDDVIESDKDTEEQDLADGSFYPAGYPYAKEVDVREDKFSTYELLRRIKQGRFILEPDFQRNLVWTDEQKSKFIETIILNIPLPPLYVNQDKEGKYIIIDGLQRTTTLQRFMPDNKDDGFALIGLKTLTAFNGSQFKDLPPHLQATIEDRQIQLYVLKPSVPAKMIYDIFDRINTGGTPLNRQEVRNCIYIGKATQLLKELSELDIFKKAIGYGIASKRMKDREAILRYLAFKMLGFNNYENDIDDFLTKALKEINNKDETEIIELKDDFTRVMHLTYNFFNSNNFRIPTNKDRGRVNIAVLESVCCFFSSRDDNFLIMNEKQIKNNYVELIRNGDYIDAVSSSTGNFKKVKARFELASDILGKV